MSGQSLHASTRITQLASGQTSLRVSNSIGGGGAGTTTNSRHEPDARSTTADKQQQPLAATLPLRQLMNLINANTMQASTAAASDERTNNNEPSPTTNTHVTANELDQQQQQQQSVGSEASGLSPTTSAGLVGKNGVQTEKQLNWLNWLESELNRAIAQFASSIGQNSNQISPKGSRVNSSISLAIELARAFAFSSSNRSIDVLQSPISSSSASYNKILAPPTPTVEINNQTTAERQVWQFLHQHKLVLYTCAATNTRQLLVANSNKQQSNNTTDTQMLTRDHHQQLKEDQQQLNDKLAQIGPIFASILVQQNVRPRWVQMFLVGRRRQHLKPAALSSSSFGGLGKQLEEQEERIELTPLTLGQDLHLNLTPLPTNTTQSAPLSAKTNKKFSFNNNNNINNNNNNNYNNNNNSNESASLLLGAQSSGELQLQFACLVGGSLPQAKVEWTQSEKSKLGEENLKPLVSDSLLENKVLLDAIGSTLMKNNSAQRADKRYYDDDDDEFTINSAQVNHLSKQWSTLRLHNITIADHETVIRCSASNENFYLLSKSSSSSSTSSDSYYNNHNNQEPLSSDHHSIVEQSSTGARLSTWVRLNITHVPQVELKLEIAPAPPLFSTNASSNLPESVNFLEQSFTTNNNDLKFGGKQKFTFANNGDHHFMATGYNQPRINQSKIDNNLTPENGVVVEQTTQYPVIYGQNVSLFCNVTFTNPALSKAIEWSLLLEDNDLSGHSEKSIIDDNTRTTISTSPVLIIDKIQLSNQETLFKHNSVIEKLTVQFTKLEQHFQLTCRARNAFGSSNSNVVRIVTGQLPYCSQNNNDSFSSDNSDSNNNNNNSSSANNDYNISNDSGADKEMKMSNTVTVRCPVISDKSSSSFYYSIEGSKEVVVFESNVIPLSSLLSAVGQLDVLADTKTRTTLPTMTVTEVTDNALQSQQSSTSNQYYKQQHHHQPVDSNSIKITCFANDKFGSNELNPCVILLGAHNERLFKPEIDAEQQQLSTSATTHNCAANVVQEENNNPMRPRVDYNNNHLTNSIIGYNDQKLSVQSLENKSKLILTIVCKDEQSKRHDIHTDHIDSIYERDDDDDDKDDNTTDHADVDTNVTTKTHSKSSSMSTTDELVHFDLYNKRHTRYIKHLTSYPKIHGLPLTNLSMKFELLDAEFDKLSIEDLKQQHVIVVSVTDPKNGQLKKPNVTLFLNTNSSALTQQLAQLNHPHSTDIISANGFSSSLPSDANNHVLATGYRDQRLWLISLVFLSTIMLTLVAYVCKSNTTGRGSRGINKDRNSAAAQSVNKPNTKTNGNRSNSNNINDFYSSKQQGHELSSMQTELYLVGGSSGGNQRQVTPLARPAVYHNVSTSDQEHLLFAPDCAGMVAGCSSGGVSSEIGEAENEFMNSYAGSSMERPQRQQSSGYDFVIIDSSNSHESHIHTSNEQMSHQQNAQPSILLIESPDSLTTTTATTTTNTNACSFDCGNLNNHDHELCGGGISDGSNVDHSRTLANCETHNDCQGRIQTGRILESGQWSDSQGDGLSSTLSYGACSAAYNDHHQQQRVIQLMHPLTTCKDDCLSIKAGGAILEHFCHQHEPMNEQHNRQLEELTLNHDNLPCALSADGSRTSESKLSFGCRSHATSNCTKHASFAREKLAKSCPVQPARTTLYINDPQQQDQTGFKGSQFERTANCYNLDQLNSQGELTITDESSSLFHEDHNFQNSNTLNPCMNGDQTRHITICDRCRDDEEHHLKALTDQQNINIKCTECMRMYSNTSTTPDESQTPKSHINLSQPQEGGSSRQNSTLKRLTGVKSKSERVRFIDNY